jgi:DNA polymerase-3 subunit alpha
LFNLDAILAFASKLHKEAAAGQVDLFSGDNGNDAILPTLHLQKTSEDVTSEREFLQWERALLGVYLSDHPLEIYRDYLSHHATDIAKITHDMEGQSVTVGGFISDVRKITTRNGMNMAFVKIEDLSGELELIIFPKLFEATQDLWEVDRVITAKGKVNTKDRDGHKMSELKILADEAMELNHEVASSFKPSKAKPTAAQQLIIQVPSSDDVSKLTAMKELLSKYKGTCEVVVVIGNKEATKIRLPFTVNVSEELTVNLQKLFSEEAVKIK